MGSDCHHGRLLRSRSDTMKDNNNNTICRHKVHHFLSLVTVLSTSWNPFQQFHMHQQTILNSLIYQCIYKCLNFSTYLIFYKAKKIIEDPGVRIHNMYYPHPQETSVNIKELLLYLIPFKSLPANTSCRSL